MDPHTARCLQLSTSICMPFNPYRPHRFPDPVSRSRFPVNAPIPNMRMMPTNTLPPKAWQATTAQNPTYQQTSYKPIVKPQSGFVQQQYRAANSQPSRTPVSMGLEASYFQTCLTPEKQTMNNPWDEALNPASGTFTADDHDNFNLSLESQRQESTQMFTGGTTEGFDSLAQLVDDAEPWNFGPTSPDRQSWSSLSASSGEVGSDFTDTTDPTVLSTHLGPYAGLGMAFNADDLALSSSQDGHSRMANHAENGPSMHDIQRSWSYSSDNFPSSNVSTTCHGLSTTQCCSPSEDWHDKLMITDLDFPFNGASGLRPDNVFEMADGDLESFQLSSIEVPKPHYSYDDLFLSTLPGDSQGHTGVTSVLPSSGHFDLFHNHTSTIDNCENHYTDLSEAPDLFGPLEDDQLSPDPEDMNPQDTDLTPRKQELRFEGDLYTPQYVRGHGNKREGWCGICKPGRWLVLKNSAFWYDKSFTHGISAASGMGFDGPKKTRRMSGNPDVWEGLCGSCGDWIALISSKKKGTTWFRHAYKCHTHQKIKDTPKRRREGNQCQVSKSTRTKRVKHESRDHSPESNASTVDEVDEGSEVADNKVSALQTISAIA